jgi:predicted SprT family Zn-dependent metalloprotease
MFIPASQALLLKFGKLRLKNSCDIKLKSNKKVEWICDCGRTTLAVIANVTKVSDGTKSCGRCNELDAIHFKTTKYGRLKLKYPKSLLKGSHKKVEWICDCGREKLISIKKVISGHITSCGLCNFISAEEIASRKFGKLRIKIPQDIFPGSNKKIEWICDCGREKLIRVADVLFGFVISCKKCNQISIADIATKKFGKLRIKTPQDILPGSNKKIEWICDCGKEKLIRIIKVILGHTTSCGHCSELVKNWYIQNREQIRSLKCPIDPKNFIPGGIIPLEIIQRAGKSFKAICPVCKGIYFPRFGDIRLGLSLTCGCSTYRISMPVIQINEYIRSLGFEIQNEYKVNKLAYDIFVPAKNLLIEFQGDKWHSSEKSKERDLRKKQNAIQNGYQFMEILEKDWKTKRDEIKNNIKNYL